ncbi:MAG: CDP-alcohol phosphatidyltransferase family protein [Nitrososphaeraceae archaeon]
MMRKLGLTFASLGVSANFWTTISLATSIAAGAVYAIASSSTTIGMEVSTIRFSWLYASVIGGILLLISGFFDVIDGSVARATKQTSKKGAFLDSSFDKISEAIIFIGIAAGNLANPILCMIALSLSILVSYVRARAESLGVELKGIGIGERAERLLIIAIMGMIPVIGAMQWAVIVVSVVAGLTLIQRIAVASKKL